ncbi:MAG: hypothetical protein V4819_02650 [Verrucomicrobiota bacterium]
MPSNPRLSGALKRRLTSLFLGAWLLVLFVDALPRTSQFHQRLKDWVDPFLDVTGLWQGTWQLFAPNPDKIDIRMTAEITYADGSTRSWESPDWRDMSSGQKFVNFRAMEYFDNVRRNDNSAAWGSLADYLARTIPAPGGFSIRPTKVKLARCWSLVPPLKDGLHRPHRERRAFEGPYVLLERNY